MLWQQPWNLYLSQANLYLLLELLVSSVCCTALSGSDSCYTICSYASGLTDFHPPYSYVVEWMFGGYAMPLTRRTFPSSVSWTGLIFLTVGQETSTSPDPLGHTPRRRIWEEGRTETAPWHSEKECQRIHNCTVEVHSGTARHTCWKIKSVYQSDWREMSPSNQPWLPGHCLGGTSSGVGLHTFCSSLPVEATKRSGLKKMECVLRYITSVQPTDGSSGPLVIPLSVMRTGFLAKGARSKRGSRKYPIARCWLQSWSSVPPSNRPGW